MKNDLVVHEQLINQALIDHTVFISDRDLAEICVISAEDLQTSLQRLADLGIIEILGAGRYIINFAKVD